MINFEDGLWDILLGLIFLALAVYPVTRELLGPELNVGLFLGVLAILAAGQIVLRHIVSTPRIGYVRPVRSPKLRAVLAFTAVMVLITFGLLLYTLLSPGAEPAPSEIAAGAAGRSYLVEWIMVPVLGLIFSALGYFFGVPRAYAYGWLLGLANLASVYMVHNAGWTFLLPLAIAALIILAIGAALLVRFLGKYAGSVEEG